MSRFDTFFFVRKLNDPTSERVRTVEQEVGLYLSLNKYTQIYQAGDITDRTLIIAIGGDGTMLEAMRMAADTAAVCTGFHAGKVGFLNDFPLAAPNNTVRKSVEELLKLMDDEFIDQYIEQRTTLAVTRHNGCTVSQIRLACNEIAVAPIFSDHLIKYELFINSKSAGVHKANSIIISTATGSTAYSLSAGGSLILPESNVLQIVPVAASTLTSRPIIVPADAKIRLHIPGQLEVSIRYDGMKAPFSDLITESINIHQQQPAQILHHPNWNFFDTLATKLGWIKHCD